MKSTSESYGEVNLLTIAIKNKELAEKSYELARKFILGMKKNEVQ